MPTWTDVPILLVYAACAGLAWLAQHLLRRYHRSPRQCYVCLAYRARRDRALRGGTTCICCAQQQRAYYRAGQGTRYWQTVRVCQEAGLRGPALWQRVGMALYHPTEEPHVLTPETR